MKGPLALPFYSYFDKIFYDIDNPKRYTLSKEQKIVLMMEDD